LFNLRWIKVKCNVCLFKPTLQLWSQFYRTKAPIHTLRKEKHNGTFERTHKQRVKIPTSECHHIGNCKWKINILSLFVATNLFSSPRSLYCPNHQQPQVVPWKVDRELSIQQVRDNKNLRGHRFTSGQESAKCSYRFLIRSPFSLFSICSFSFLLL
jgi:hypothetical protein